MKKNYENITSLNLQKHKYIIFNHIFKILWKILRILLLCKDVWVNKINSKKCDRKLYKTRTKISFFCEEWLKSEYNDYIIDWQVIYRIILSFSVSILN